MKSKKTVKEKVASPVGASLSEILCKVGIPDSQEEPDVGDIEKPDLFPKQHECKPDYIKMFVWGAYLNEYNGLFNDGDATTPKNQTSEAVFDNDVNEDLEVQFLDGDTLEELEINMATTEEKEFFDEPFDVALDSGAGDHVTAEKDAPNYEVEPSRGSKMGQNFVTACKQKLANKGQVNLKLRSGERARGKGTDIKTVFQIADVKRPLWSVSKICDAGFTVKFTQDRAVVLDKKGKVCVTFERRGGLYVARLMMKNPKFKKNEDFHRPGK